MLNRATGYIGTASTSVVDVSERAINISLPDIRLFPPNLQIQVDRQYQVEKGLTAGESRHYRVGSEGAALTSDQYVSIHTQWLNHDGTALSSELPGYTGRLANLVGDGELNSSSVNQFSIEPGKHTEVLQLPNAALSSTAAHQYLHVVGREFNAMPDKPNLGADPGSEFPERPGKFVPVKVAVFDKEASEELQKTQKALDLEGVKQDSSVYRWVYRPEMQYSVFELDIQQILRTPENNETPIDIIEADTPVISASDSGLQIQQLLTESEYNPLALFGPDSDLVLSIEEYQKHVEPSDNAESGPWTIDSLAHLGALESEDFLSINLLNNHDAGNILWEWAFEYLYLDTQDSEIDKGDEQIFISADVDEILLEGALIGYENRREDKKKPVRVQWLVDGAGSMDERAQILEDNGHAVNSFFVSKTAGSRATIELALADDATTKAMVGEFVTVPGRPAKLNVQLSGNAYVAGGGPVTVTVTVRDGAHNLVADDTGVNIRVLGSAVVNDYNPGTRDGVVRAEVRGGMYAGNATIVVDVDGGILQEQHAIVIKPYTVSINNIADRVGLGESGEFTLSAVDDSGNPPPVGTPFQLFAEGLVIKQDSAVSDAQGEAQVSFQAGYAPTDVELRASVGYTDGVIKTVEVHNQTVAGASSVNVEQIVLIGDRAAEGSVDFERFDGVTLGLPYVTQLNVQVSGTPGSVRELSLGTPERPNVEPIVAYYMSDEGDLDNTPIGRDAMGSFHADVLQTSTTSETTSQPLRVNHYRAHAGDSLVFDGDSYLRSSIPGSRLDAESFGFRLDAYVDEQSTEELFALGNELVKLELLEDNRLQLSVKEAVVDAQPRTVKLTSMALSTGWHSIAGVLQAGELTLYLDGTMQWSERLTSLALPTEPSQALNLAIGRQFIGALDNLELYDPGGPPLLQLSDGVTTGNTLSVPVDNTGTRTVRVQSTGQLNQAYATTLAQRSVLLTSSEGTQDFINLLSTESYRDLAGVYAVSLYAGDELPAIDDAALDSAMLDTMGGPMSAMASVGNYFISPANAGFFGLSKSSFLSGFSSFASLLLPINEIKAIWLQMGHLATDPSKFEPGELVINIISLATYFPVLRPLQVVVKPLKTLYRRFGNKPYTKAVGGVLGDAFDQLYKKRNADKLLSLVPYLLIVGEMSRHPEAIEFMIEAIQSTDDLWVWINYLNLPIDGWEGDGPAPKVAQLNADTLSATQVGSASSLLGFFVNQAEAAPRPRGKRRNGGNFGLVLKNTVKKLNGIVTPSQFTDGIRVMESTVRSGAAAGLRTLTQSGSIMTGTAILARYSQGRFKLYLSGKTDARIPAPMFLTIVSYLEREMSVGYLSELPDADHIERQIRIHYVKAMAPVVAPVFNRFVEGGSHGAMFELAVLGYYTAVQEVQSFQRVRWVRFHKDATEKGRKQFEKASHNRKRTVDIILNGDDDSEVWIELKSLARRNLNDPYLSAIDGFKTWGAAVAENTVFKNIRYHKQFSVDRAALNGNAVLPKTQNPQQPFVKVSDFQWLFHEFRVKPKPKYGVNERKSVKVGVFNRKNNIRERLSDQMRLNTRGMTEERVKFVLGLPAKGEQTLATRKAMANRVKQFTALYALFEELKNAGYVDEKLDAVLRQFLSEPLT